MYCIGNLNTATHQPPALMACIDDLICAEELQLALDEWKHKRIRSCKDNGILSGNQSSDKLQLQADLLLSNIEYHQSPIGIEITQLKHPRRINSRYAVVDIDSGKHNNNVLVRCDENQAKRIFRIIPFSIWGMPEETSKGELPLSIRGTRW